MENSNFNSLNNQCNLASEETVDKQGINKESKYDSQTLSFLRNLDIGDSVSPGFKNMVLNGKIIVPLWAFLQIENIPENELKGFIELIQDVRNCTSVESIKTHEEYLASEIARLVPNDNNKTGVIYILINRSFPDYVKIGFTTDIDRRLKQLNDSACTPFPFEVYATYKVNKFFADKELHSIIDTLAPDLRAKDIDSVDGKLKTREFFAMSPEKAFSILKNIATIDGKRDCLSMNFSVCG